MICWWSVSFRAGISLVYTILYAWPIPGVPRWEPDALKNLTHVSAVRYVVHWSCTIHNYDRCKDLHYLYDLHDLHDLDGLCDLSDVWTVFPFGLLCLTWNPGVVLSWKAGTQAFQCMACSLIYSLSHVVRSMIRFYQYNYWVFVGEC